MRDLAAERISRFHGGFEDPDGEYEIVSSLSNKVKHFGFNEEEETIFGNVGGPTSDDTLFYVKVLFFLIPLATTIAVIAYRWVATSKSAERESTGKPTPCSVKTSQAGHRVQNLDSQFEKVKDVKKEEKEGKVPTEQRQYDCSETVGHRVRSQFEKDFKKEEQRQYGCVETIDTQEALEEEVLMPFSSRPAHTPPELQQYLRRRRHSNTTPPRKRSPSPPSLIDEPVPDCPQSPPPRNGLEFKSKTCPPTTPTSSSASSDASMAAMVNHSSLHPHSPQKMAQDFCQSIEMIEGMIRIRSSVKEEDSSRFAAELAMLHQKSQIKERHLQQEMANEAKKQSSEIRHRYEDNLKELPEIFLKCLNSILSAANYSLYGCLLLEAYRHGSRLMNQLEYFNARIFRETLLKMACDCEEEVSEFDGFEAPKVFAFLSFLPSSVYGGLESQWQDISNLVIQASYFPCILNYVGLLLLLMAAHTALRHMHFPVFIHQVFNFCWLGMYIANQPSAMLAVTDTMERYLMFSMVQGGLSVVSLILAVFWYFSTRHYISKRHQQIMEKGAQEDHHHGLTTPCDAGRKLARFGELALMLSLGPPLVVLVMVFLVAK